MSQTDRLVIDKSKTVNALVIITYFIRKTCTVHLLIHAVIQPANRVATLQHINSQGK